MLCSDLLSMQSEHVNAVNMERVEEQVVVEEDE